VTASEIIEEIKRLDPKEQLGVIRFAYQLDAERHLTGNELSSLAESDGQGDQPSGSSQSSRGDNSRILRSAQRWLRFGGKTCRRHY
jgi:hypothetical protein